MAAEIEASLSGNVHLREERGQQELADDNMDEEDRYSGVIRESATNESGRNPSKYIVFNFFKSLLYFVQINNNSILIYTFTTK